MPSAISARHMTIWRGVDGMRSSPRVTMPTFMIASSTGFVSVYSGEPSPRAIT